MGTWTESARSVNVFAAPYLLPGRDAEPIRNGAVALDGERVVATGPAEQLQDRYGKAEWLDAVVLPALVNAHLHLELSHLEGQVPGGEGLVAWIYKFIGARERAKGADEAMARATGSLLRAGVAAVGDVSNTLGSLRYLVDAGISGSVFLELFGFGSERARLAREKAAELRRRAGEPPPGLRVVPSPHAVYTTQPQLIAELLASGPASIHLAEDPGERAFCGRMEGPFVELARLAGAGAMDVLGRSAVAYVAPHLGPTNLVVHAVDLDAADISELVQHGSTVVLCPRSNRYILGRLPDLPRLLAARVPLAIGSDSLASTSSLSPLAELAVLHDAFPEIAPALLLPLAWNGTCVGAPTVGRLTPGSAPGIIAAPLDGDRPEDPYAWLLGYGARERSFQWLARHRPEVPSA